MSEQPSQQHPAQERPSHDDVPMLEPDETIPPRPEEEVADVARAEPDPGVED